MSDIPAPGMMIGMLERTMRASIRYLRIDAPRSEEERRLYAQVRAGFGAAVPPVTIHAVDPPLLRAVWHLSRATLLAGSTHRAWLEVAASGVSLANACPYCVDAHTGSLFRLGDDATAAAIVRGDLESVADPEHRLLAQWAARTGEAHPPALPRSLGDQLDGGALARLFGTVVAFHYVNRVVSVFLPDSPFLGPKALRSLARRNMGRVLKPTGVEHEDTMEDDPGPEVAPPFTWARPSAAVARAVSGMAAAMDTVEQGLPPAATRAVRGAVDTWDGEPPPPGLAWREAACGGLAGQERDVAALLITVALAAYRVEDELVARARCAVGTDDASLLRAVAWAAFLAARRVGKRLRRA